MKKLCLKNGNTLIIREAKKADAKKLLEYINVISNESDFLTFGKGEFQMTTEQEEKFLEEVSRFNNALYIIAEIQGKIVGSLSFIGGSRPRIEHAGEMGVSVLKECWGNGIGTELTKYLIKWGEHSGIIRKINLRVRTDNLPAIHIYKKLGFVKEGTIQREIRINDEFYDTIFMGYTIN